MIEKNEQIGLGIAAIGHILLFVILSLSLLSPPDEAFRNPPLEVMITDEVGLESTAPNPARVPPATSVAPEIGDPVEAPPPNVTNDLLSEPEPQDKVTPPTPQPTAKPTPKPATKPTPQPTPSAQSKPKPKPAPDRSERRRPDRPESRAVRPKPAAKPAAKPTPKPSDTPAKGARLGDDFLKGVSDTPSPGKSQTPRAERAGPAAQASLRQELYRRIKAKWTPPTGADVEKLRTKVTARLDSSGNIIGTPAASTTGITPSNRNQVAVHQERAIAAVRLAAPYTTFPAQYYEDWKVIEPVLYLGL
jgi:hypothetical protein